MGWSSVILLAFALAADAVSVAAVVGLHHHKPRELFRISFHFGLFQALFPLLGILTGELLFSLVSGEWDSWIAFAILVFIGARMVKESLSKHDDGEEKGDPTRGLVMVGLSAAVSIDAFGAGVSLATARVPLIAAVALIGLVTAGLALVSMLSAAWIRKHIGSRIETVAGLILIGIGIKILVS